MGPKKVGKFGRGIYTLECYPTIHLDPQNRAPPLSTLPPKQSSPTIHLYPPPFQEKTSKITTSTGGGVVSSWGAVWLIQNYCSRAFLKSFVVSALFPSIASCSGQNRLRTPESQNFREWTHAQRGNAPKILSSQVSEDDS